MNSAPVACPASNASVPGITLHWRYHLEGKEGPEDSPFWIEDSVFSYYVNRLPSSGEEQKGANKTL